jgi:hypothetical protein
LNRLVWDAVEVVPAVEEEAEADEEEENARSP